MGIRNKYTLGGKIELAYYLIRTRLEYPTARLIRFPIDVRGKRFIDFGKNLTTGVGCRLEAFSANDCTTLFFGKDVQLNDYVHITAMEKVLIGNRVLMAGKIYISDCTHGYYKEEANLCSSPDEPPVSRAYHIEPVVIEDNVWIGENVCVLPGSHIGKGTVIGANSVVKGNILPGTIAVGAPARVVKRFDTDRKGWFKTDTQGNFID